MDRIKSFYDENVAPANEGLADAAIIAGVAAIFAIPTALYARHGLKKIQQEQAKNTSAKNPEQKMATVKKAAAEVYNIQIMPIPAGQITNQDQLIRQLQADAKKYLAAMKRSKIYKDYLERCVEEGQRDWNEQWTTQELDHEVSIQEGVNGWEESIHVIDGSQEMCIVLGDVVWDLSEMLEARFANYITDVSCGDGDEGHIYYNIKKIS